METAEKTIESTEEVGAVSMSPSTSLLAEFDKLCSDAFVTYADILKRPECCGKTAKLADGSFGQDELTAHVMAAEMYGMHIAYARVCKRMRAANVTHEPLPKAGSRKDG